MSEIIKSRLDSICPSENLENSMMSEVESWVSIAFQKINYTPKNLGKSLDKAWHNANPKETIPDFVYRVWRYDK